LDQAVGYLVSRFSTVTESAGVPVALPRNGDVQAVTSCIVMMGAISGFFLLPSEFPSIRHCYLPGAGFAGPGVRLSDSTL